MALKVLAGFGAPEEVARRYAPRGFSVIEPEHGPLFVKLAALCVMTQWALTLPPVFRSPNTLGDWWLGWGAGAFWWVGVLTVWFGCAAWIRRRIPADDNGSSRHWTHWLFWVPMPARWRPRDPERVSRRASGMLLPVTVALAIFFVAPAWFLERLLPAGTDTSWAQYDSVFQGALLAPLIALIAVRIVLFSATLVNVRWQAQTEGVRFVLWVALVGLLYWAVLDWDIFANAAIDFAFKVWLGLFLTVNTIQIVVQSWRALLRVRTPGALRTR
jgi:hypothetical protein